MEKVTISIGQLGWMAEKNEIDAGTTIFNFLKSKGNNMDTIGDDSVKLNGIVSPLSTPLNASGMLIISGKAISWGMEVVAAPTDWPDRFEQDGAVFVRTVTGDYVQIPSASAQGLETASEMVEVSSEFEEVTPTQLHPSNMKVIDYALQSITAAGRSRNDYAGVRLDWEAVADETIIVAGKNYTILMKQ